MDPPIGENSRRGEETTSSTLGRSSTRAHFALHTHTHTHTLSLFLSLSLSLSFSRARDVLVRKRRVTPKRQVRREKTRRASTPPSTGTPSVSGEAQVARLVISQDRGSGSRSRSRSRARGRSAAYPRVALVSVAISWYIDAGWMRVGTSHRVTGRRGCVLHARNRVGVGLAAERGGSRARGENGGREEAKGSRCVSSTEERRRSRTVGGRTRRRWRWR